MSRGYYITANDKVLDQAIALLNSIRSYDTETPVILIPYDDHYQTVASVLGERFGVQVFEDLELIDRLSKNLQEIFGSNYFARPNQFRKQACWFGPLDEFAYIDTDIVVFDKLITVLDYFQDCDFLCYDFQHVGGIRNVFAPKILEDQVFTDADLKGMFNGGFWASKKGLLSEQDLYDSFRECAAHPEYFDFSQKTSDQPIINYMILKRVPRRFNVVHRPEKAPGSWAGSKHFIRDEQGRLVDPNVNQPLQYLHWAGIRIQPGCPYWDVWEHYRYLGEEKPMVQPTQLVQKNLLQRAVGKLKKLMG